MSSAKAARAAGMSPAAKLAYACSMISLLEAVIWNSSLYVGDGCRLQRRRSFRRRGGSFGTNHLIPSGGPDDVVPWFVAARDACDDRLLEVRSEIRRAGRQLADGVADRSGHVAAGLFGWGTGPPGPCPEPRRSLAVPARRPAL